MIDINIGLKDASIKNKIEELNNLEQKLFLISLVLENNSKSGLSFQLNEEITIFKEINFSIKKFNNNHLIVVISHVYYSLEPYRRIITFIDEKQSIR